MIADIFILQVWLDNQTTIGRHIIVDKNDDDIDIQYIDDDDEHEFGNANHKFIPLQFFIQNMKFVTTKFPTMMMNPTFASLPLFLSTIMVRTTRSCRWAQLWLWSTSSGPM